MSKQIMFVVPYSMVSEIKTHVDVTKSFGLVLTLKSENFQREFEVSSWHCGSLQLGSENMRVVDKDAFHFTSVFVAEFSGLYGSVLELSKILDELGIPYYTDLDDSDARQCFKQSFVDLQPAYSLHTAETFDQEVRKEHWLYSHLED